jgi:thymidylate synthase (FAD)
MLPQEPKHRQAEIEEKINSLTVREPSFEVLTPDGWTSGMVPLIEQAGRVCYKSEHKITPGSANKFVSHFCRNLGHTSMIEHAFATVVWTGSRAMSHQLVRHRLAAYSQESQRYCDYGKKGFQVVAVPTVGIKSGAWTLDMIEHGADEGLYRWSHEDGDMLYCGQAATTESRLKFQWLMDCRDEYAKYLWWRLMAGFRPEDARFHLPNGTKTEVAATYDFHMWRHIFEHRGLNPRAQWEIRSIAQQILKVFAEKWPAVFGDLLEQIQPCNDIVGKADLDYRVRRDQFAEGLTAADFRLGT